jgi:hypothetical protein
MARLGRLQSAYAHLVLFHSSVMAGRRSGHPRLQPEVPRPHLDYRVSPLRGGPAMTEKNRIVLRDETNEPRFSNRTAVGLVLE